MSCKCYQHGTDTVPAMLTPHEAVLNRNAADILGRDKIRKLNAMGNSMEQYQDGTADVLGRPPIILPRPAQGIDPAAEHAFLQRLYAGVQSGAQRGIDLMSKTAGALGMDYNARGYQQGTEDVQHPFNRAARVLEAYNYIPKSEERQSPVRGYQEGTSDVPWVPITDPNDPRLKEFKPNQPSKVGFATNSDPFLFGFRRNYQQELQDPAVRKAVFNVTHNEVGSSDPAKTIGFMEGLINRANSRHQTVMEAASDAGYYPKSSLRPATVETEDTARYNQYLDTVLNGSNISNFSTGNASYDPTTGKWVGFGGGPATAQFGTGKTAELAGLEKADYPWFRNLQQTVGTGLSEPPPHPIVPYRPGAEGGEATGVASDINAPGGYNEGPAAFAAAQAAQPTPPAPPTGWELAGKGLQTFGEDVSKQAAARTAQANAAISSALGGVPTSNPLLAQLAADPNSPLRNAIAMATPLSSPLSPAGGMPPTPPVPYLPTSPLQDQNMYPYGGQ